MTAPSMMFERRLTPAKGWADMTSLDFSAKLAAAVTFSITPGRVVHVNEDGEFETGIGATDMAIFLWNGKASLDVSNPGMTPAGNFMQQPIFPAGDMSGLVATGGYELETTEFDSEQEYTPGDLLTAAVANTNATTGGRLTNVGTGAGNVVEQYLDPACGVVSRGVVPNEHGIDVLCFWPIYLPGAA